MASTEVVTTHERPVPEPPLAAVVRQPSSHSATEMHRLDSIAAEGESNAVHAADIPPDGGYGWIVTACVFLINAHTWGVNSAWGVFLNHFLSDATFPHATHFQYALIGGISISQALTVSPAVSLANERFGTRNSLFLGTILVSAALLCSAFATGVWALFLTQGALFGWGMGFLYITASTVLPQWFLRRRSLAVGIASSGAGFGGLAYNLGAGAGISSIGWKSTYITLAAATFAVNLACSFLLKDRDKAVQPRRQGFQVKEYGHISTWMIIVWGFLTELGYVVLLYSLPNYATYIGLTPQQGAVAGAVLNLGLAFGRPAIGYASDTFGRINVALATTALCGAFCLGIWVPAKSYSVLLLFAFLSGTVTGTFWGCVIPVTAEVVGIQRLSVSFGMICLPLVLPTTFAESIALRLVSSSGYLAAQIFVGCVYLGGALSLWGLRSWKIGDIARNEGRDRTGISTAQSGNVGGHANLRLAYKSLLAPKKV